MAVSTGTAILGSAAIGALAGGSKKGGNTTVQQNADPWIGVQPYLKDLFGRSQTQSQQGVSPYTTQAQGLLAQRALDGSPLNSLASAQVGDTLSGEYLDPFQQGALKDVMGMTKSQINGQFSGDNFGNSAHQEWLQRGLMGAAMPYASQAYNAERQRQLGAAALAPTLAGQDYVDIGQLASIGQQEQDFPWQQLQRYQQALSASSGGQTTTQQPYFTNPMANALGMGLGGLGLYNGLRQSGLLGAGLVPEMVPGQYSLMNPAYG